MQKKYFNQPGQKEPTTPKEALRQLSILFYTLSGSVLFFTVIMYLLSRLQPPVLTDEKITRIIFIAVLLVSALLLTIAEKKYKSMLSQAMLPEQNPSLMEKLRQYRSALVFYLAYCEGPALFSILIFFITGQKLFMAIVALLLIAMFLKKPDKARIVHDLQLSSEEQMAFQ